MDLLPDVLVYIEGHRLLEPGEGVVVGVSGGPDSIALLDLLARLASEWELRLQVAHLHHGMRGLEADADADFVVKRAEAYGLPWTLERVELPAVAREQGLALEEAARRVRYAFLARVARRVGARSIAVAHNAGDQAETILMHLLRGAGPAGLRGMLPKSPLPTYDAEAAGQVMPPLRLVRPLLGTTREEIEVYCTERDLEPRFDRTNLDTTFFRNQLRHEVLPYLAQVSPQIEERLRHLAEVVRADYELLEAHFDAAWEALIIYAYEDAVAFDLEGWRASPLAVQRALVRRAAYALRKTLRDVSFVHVDAAVEVARAGTTGAQATLPRNLVLEVRYEALVIGDERALHLPADRPWLEQAAVVPLSVPGTTPLPAGWALHIEEVEAWDLGTIVTNPHPLVAWMDAAALEERPRLRTRREGDRFEPQGMGGAEVRLSDFLINAKMPWAWREHLPLLMGDDILLWVVGERLSEAAIVRSESERVLRLEFRREG
jgi:tRNA(Ile)-lysidine synthase